MSDIKTLRQRKQSLTKNTTQQIRNSQNRSKSTISLAKKSSLVYSETKNLGKYLIGWGRLPFPTNELSYNRIAKNILKFGVGEEHIVYLNTKGQFDGIGSNNYGQLSFKQIKKLPVKTMFCTSYCTFLILCNSPFYQETKQLLACGLNNRGQLGIKLNEHFVTNSLSEVKFYRKKNYLGQQCSNRVNKYMVDEEQQTLSAFYEKEQILEICGGPFHTVVLTNFGRLFYTGNLYNAKSIKKDEFIDQLTEINLKLIGKIKKVKSGDCSIGFINYDNKLYLMGLLTQNVIFDEPQYVSIQNVKDFALTQKQLFTINQSGEVYMTDITECNLKPKRIFIPDSIVEVISWNNGAIFNSRLNTYGIGQICELFETNKKKRSYELPQKININISIDLHNLCLTNNFVISFSDEEEIINIPFSPSPLSYISDQNRQNEIQKCKRPQKLSIKTQTQQKNKENKIQMYNCINSRTFQSSLDIPFNQIKVGKLISQGGYGLIYQAEWRKTTVAVKIFKIQQKNTNSIRDFISQCRAMEALRHPNIVMFLGACTKSPNFGIVLEYCEGGTLWSLLQGSEELNWERRKKIALELAKAMNYLHSRDTPILHRDLKSLNVLLDHSGRVKLADFGWTKGLQNYMTAKIGTYQWMAPQVVSAEQYTEKADIFSFGIILWQIASRQPPYKNIPGPQVAHDVLHKDLRPQIPKKTPEIFAQLIKKCWMKNYSLRPSFQQIIVDIQSMNF